MRIALTQEDFRPSRGGAEGVALAHARMLSRAGHETHVFSLAIEDLPEGLIAHRLTPPRGASRRSGFARALEAELSRQDCAFDIVHGYGKSVGMDLLQAGGGLHRVWMDYELRSRPKGLSRAWARFRRFLYPDQRAVLAIERRQYVADVESTRYVALSRMVQGHMRDVYGVPEERIHQIYLGVDLERFHPDTRLRYRDAVRRRLDMSEDDVVLVLMAHNFRLKGLEPLIRALAELKGRGKTPDLIAAGRGKPGRFQRIAAALGVGAQVRFVGPAERPEEYYAAADLFVHPTFYDPCATVVFEALGCGLPVITSIYNGSGEILTPGVEGSVIDPGKPTELADAIERFLDPDRLREASLAARRLAEQYPVQRYFQSILEVYELILAEKSAGTSAAQSPRN